MKFSETYCTLIFSLRKSVLVAAPYGALIEIVPGPRNEYPPLAAT